MKEKRFAWTVVYHLVICAVGIVMIYPLIWICLLYTSDPYIEFFKLYEDGIKDGWMVSPAVFAERTIGSVEQDPLIYGSSPETMSW